MLPTRRSLSSRFRVAYGLVVVLCGLAAPLGPTAALADGAPPASETTISVRLSSGRTFTAMLDARTDSTQLWLRCEQAGAELLRPIAWDRVVSAEVAGQTISGEELCRLVIQMRQEIPAQPVVPVAKAHIVMIGQPDVGTPAERHAAATTDLPNDVRRVVSLAIDASVGRWDENVDPDGLLVHVYPLDADGAVVPVRGTLNVNLKLQQRSIDWLHQPFVDAGHWSEAVHTSDFGRREAVYRLRFQSIQPEFDDRVRSPGLVHACLAVPGQGTFEASTYLASIRPFNPVRDRLQAVTRHDYFSGDRYFSDERTDNGRR